jgi:hypothetical protein
MTLLLNTLTLPPVLKTYTPANQKTHKTGPNACNKTALGNRGTLHARKGLLRRLTMQHKVIEFLALAATGAAFGALLAWGAFL